MAAVYEHAVILPSSTPLPVSHSEALALMNRNLDLLEGAIVAAAKQVSSSISSPERAGGRGVCGSAWEGWRWFSGNWVTVRVSYIYNISIPTFFVLLEQFTSKLLYIPNKRSERRWKYFAHYLSRTLGKWLYIEYFYFHFLLAMEAKV